MAHKTFKTISQDFALTFLNFVNQNPPRLTLFKSCEPSGAKTLHCRFKLKFEEKFIKFLYQHPYLKLLKFIRGARRERREIQAFLGSFGYNGFTNLYFKRIKNGEYLSLLLFRGGCEQDQ